ncbi:MAG TPA: ABC transporter substrate binding protein [Spirochaetota bacterium]|nr:ABC transporter substrate binding protein [Spirochaetota bacterium]
MEIILVISRRFAHFVITASIVFYGNILFSMEKNILVLHSYHPSYVWTDSVQKGIESVFPLTSSKVLLSVEYMDTKRFTLEEIAPTFATSLKVKYVSKDFDAIIIADNNALTFFHDQRDTLFKDVPAVFCGINDYTDDMLKNDSLLTGVAEKTNSLGTLKLMQKIFPERQKIVVIVDTTVTGEAEYQRFKRYSKEIEGLDFETWMDYSPDKIIQGLSRLDDNCMVLSIIYLQSSDGSYVNFSSYLEMISKESPVPVFALWDFYFQKENAAFGGDIVSASDQGQLAAQMAKQIIEGVSVKDIPVIKGNTSIPVIDYRQLTKFRIAKGAIPKNVTYLFDQDNFLNEKLYQFIRTILLVSVVGALCVLVMINIYSRRKTEKSLIDAQNTLAALFENIPGMAYRSKSENGFPFLFVSRGSTHITGYHAKELNDRTLLDLIVHDDSETVNDVQKEIDKSINERTPFELEYRIRKKDGSVISVWNHGIYNNNGKFIEGLILDISDRVAANMAMQESEGWFQKILNSHVDGIVIHEHDTLRTLDVNDSALEMFGYEKAEFTKMYLSDIVSGNPPYTTESFLYRYKITDDLRNQQFECEVCKKDGSLFWCEIFVKSIEINDNKYILSFIRDITERKKSRMQLKEKEEQLRHAQKMDAIGQLAGGIAHDFNNMLGGILGAAELMLIDPQDSELVKEYARLIIDTTAHASDLTENLLAFSRKGKVLSTPVDCHKIIEDTIKILKRSIDRRIVLQKDLRAQKTMIIGDPGQIQNIVLNLGINARDAMPDGGRLSIATSNVTLDKQKCESSGFDMHEGDYLCITISDTGTGIEASVIDKIFEPFFTTKTIGAGTGLGLAAAYGSVTEHKGSISVSSKKGEGSVFTILLPLSDKNRVSCDEVVGEVPLGKGTVLLAEDESFVRNTAVHILEDLGYTVIIAENGKDAFHLYKIHREKIDLVLLDMIMPGYSGEECFYKIREIDPFMPIVVCSGFAHEQDISKMTEEGLNGFLLKPYRRFELAQMLYKVLNKEDCV